MKSGLFFFNKTNNDSGSFYFFLFYFAGYGQSCLVEMVSEFSNGDVSAVVLIVSRMRTKWFGRVG